MKLAKKALHRYSLYYRGISPVISVILLLTITVVLAAILFVMVLGFGGNQSHSPIGLWSKAEIIDSHTEKLTLTSIEPSTTWIDCRILIENITSGTTDTITTFTMSHSAGVVTCTKIDGNLNITITGTDINKDNAVSQGDFIMITGLISSTESQSYKVSLIYIVTGSLIDDIVFYR